MRSQGAEAAVVVGGIIPEEDAVTLQAAGVTSVYTPKDFELVHIMEDLISIVEARRS
jgi:(2R)-ethylmalonyl-CoA mutase